MLPSSAAEPILVGDRQRDPELPAHPGTDHPARAAIVSSLEETPGLNLRSLCVAINANQATATHHLDALNRFEVVASVTSSRERRFFLTWLGRNGSEEAAASSRNMVLRRSCRVGGPQRASR